MTLQQQPELAEFFKILLQAKRPLQLKPIIADKLSNMGLIQQIDDKAVVSCELYRLYFTKNFAEINLTTQPQ